MNSSIQYDIDELLDGSGDAKDYEIASRWWGNLTLRDRALFLAEELYPFDLYEFSVYTGNGFGCRMDFNHDNGIADLFRAKEACEALGLTDSARLLGEVEDLLKEMWVTREYCGECRAWSLCTLDRYLDASDLLGEEGVSEEGRPLDLYGVFEKLDAKRGLTKRWWSEGHELKFDRAIYEHLQRHREALRVRKPK